MRGSRESVLACVVAVAIVAAIGSSAQAETPPDPTERVVDALKVAPDLGAVARPSERAEGELVAALPDSPVVEMSANGDEVSLASPGGPAIALTLPDEVETGKAVVAADGTVVYASATALGADVAVQALDGAVSIQTVIPDKRSVHAFTYRLGDDVSPRLRDDGGVDLLGNVDGAVTIVGQIAAPWAVAADGSPVATTYEVAGGKVVQVVATTDATAYPVVADPLLTYGWGVYLNLRGYAWKAVAATLVGAAVGVTTAACLGAKLPAAWAKAVGAGCTLLGVSTGVSALMSAIKQVRNMSVQSTGCYQIMLLNIAHKPNVGRLTKVASSQCA